MNKAIMKKINQKIYVIMYAAFFLFLAVMLVAYSQWPSEAFRVVVISSMAITLIGSTWAFYSHITKRQM